MKKHIQAMLSGLRKTRKDYTPPIPSPSAKAPVLNQDPSVPSPDPDDLSNQILSDDPSERVRQLDYQAQRLEEKGTSEG
jgi:hypothetical protein